MTYPGGNPVLTTPVDTYSYCSQPVVFTGTTPDIYPIITSPQTFAANTLMNYATPQLPWTWCGNNPGAMRNAIGTLLEHLDAAQHAAATHRVSRRTLCLIFPCLLANRDLVEL